MIIIKYYTLFFYFNVLKNMYKNYIGEPNGEKANSLLNTNCLDNLSKALAKEITSELLVYFGLEVNSTRMHMLSK